MAVPETRKSIWMVALGKGVDMGSFHPPGAGKSFSLCLAGFLSLSANSPEKAPFAADLTFHPLGFSFHLRVSIPRTVDPKPACWPRADWSPKREFASHGTQGDTEITSGDILVGGFSVQARAPMNTWRVLSFALLGFGSQ